MAPPRVTPHRKSRFGFLSRILFFLSLALALGMVAYRVKMHATILDFEGAVVGQEIEIASEVGGKLVRVAVEPNTPVEPGQLLAELTDETLLAEIAAAQEDVANFKRSLELARSDQTAMARLHEVREQILEASGEAVVADLDLEALRAEIGTASRTLQIAEERETRAFSLLEKAAMTRAEVEEIQLESIAARRSLDDARKRLAQMEHRRTQLLERLTFYHGRLKEVERETGERISQLEMELSRKEGELKTLLARQASLKVFSDRKGIVSQTPRSVGEIMSAGQPILFLTTGDRLWVEAYIPSEEVASVSPGDRFEIFVNPGSDPYTGWIRGILPTLRVVSRTSVGFFDDRHKIAVALVEFDDEERAKNSLLVGQEVRVRRRAW